MKVHFCRSLKPGGLFIQAATFSRWNHVAIEINGVVFDSTFAHGVACWPAEDFAGRYHEVVTLVLELPDEKAALAFLNAQLGKQYDLSALAALPFRGTWQDPDKWFCSELFAEMLRAGGIQLLDTVFKGYRVTPRDAYIVTHLINGQPIEKVVTVDSLNQ